jgi:hypothetical protein
VPRATASAEVVCIRLRVVLAVKVFVYIYVSEFGVTRRVCTYGTLLIAVIHNLAVTVVTTV